MRISRQIDVPDWLSIALSGLIFILSGCGRQAPGVEIQALQPRSSYINQVVGVQGQVIRKIPLLHQFAYEIQDRTGSIVVLASRDRWSVGSDVTAQGTLRLEQFAVSGQSLSEVYLDTTGSAEP